MTSAGDVAPAEPAVAAAPAGAATGAIGPIAVGIALLSALTTFLVLAELTPLRPTHYVVLTLLLVSALAILLLVAIIGREVWEVVQARRRGRAGSRLHVQIVGLFSVIAGAPAIFLAIVASITLDRGLDRPYSLRAQTIIANSLNVAQAYLAEHAQMIRGDVAAMAFDLARAKPLYDEDRDRFRQLLTAQAAIRRLPGAMIIDANRAVIEKADIRTPQEFIAPSSEALANVIDTEPTIALYRDANGDAKYVAAAIKLRGYDAYLYVARPIDPVVVSQLNETQTAIDEYRSLEAARPNVQVAFAFMYALIALSVLLSAAWIALNFANRLVAPIRRLIGAVSVVSRGNLHVQVPVRQSEGDLALLGETFNKMTYELRTQRDDIVRARDLMDSRRRFTEAVLAGASAGVIGVDADGKISILNRSAEKLIGCVEAEAIGKPLTEVVPELAPMIAEARSNTQRLLQGQVTINRSGDERNLSVRVTTEQSSDPTHGYVVTLDDITELVSAQRTSAWADVARRIAHEIKNPLTPIQLSAERLRRKYGSVIRDDPAVFERCTDTIVRQVDDIRRMVDEFSRFARMPKPVISAEDVADTVRQAVFLMRVGHADIDIEANIAEDPMPARFDRRLISQGLTNIIKNAAEAISAVPPEELGRGEIKISAAREGHYIVLDIIDNGIGLPKENRRRLLEPYVTTREKGTGLGLAIVGKILEEHGGRIELRDAAEKTPGARGAWVRMVFAAEPVVNEEASMRKAASER